MVIVALQFVISVSNAAVFDLNFKGVLPDQTVHGDILSSARLSFHAEPDHSICTSGGIFGGMENFYGRTKYKAPKAIDSSHLIFDDQAFSTNFGVCHFSFWSTDSFAWVLHPQTQKKYAVDLAFLHELSEKSDLRGAKVKVTCEAGEFHVCYEKEIDSTHLRADKVTEVEVKFEE